MKKILLATLFLFPCVAFANIPAFPLALWGDVTVNGAAAPSGTVIRAYYGSVLAGSVTVAEEGVYGYTEPTKQKLLIAEGSGSITFTFQKPGESETQGAAVVSHDQFTSGDTVQKNLSFSTQSEAEPQEEPESRSGGGGGGSSRSSGVVLGAQTQTASSAANFTAAQIAAIIQLMRSFGADGATLAALQIALSSPASTAPTPAPGTFTRDLTVGSVGEDVRMLQKKLNSLGFTIATVGPGSVGNETNMFGAATRAALARFQQAKGITPAIGYFGPKTRLTIESL